jgi:CYTH domain-containing protein
MEIEKKFKPLHYPENYETFEKKEIEQGYLCTEPVVRIRKSNDRYILTYKAETLKSHCDTVRMCHEFEVELTKEAYLHLKEKIDGELIKKTRYLIPLLDGHTAELDIFHDSLEGLSIVEVEFDSERDALAFVPPDWFGEDVSGDKRYTNKWLAFHRDWR